MITGLLAALYLSFRATAVYCIREVVAGARLMTIGQLSCNSVQTRFGLDLAEVTGLCRLPVLELL